nr:hypothetical protein [uncultured Clostridium sp.]
MDKMELFQTLCQVDDVTWGSYALSKDLLYGRIAEKERFAMVEAAIESGAMAAKAILRE